MGKLEDDIKTFTHEKRHPIINEKLHYSKTNPFGLFSFFSFFFPNDYFRSFMVLKIYVLPFFNGILC